MDNETWTYVNDAGDGTDGETVASMASLDDDDNLSDHGSALSYDRSPTSSTGGDVTYRAHVDDTDDEGDEPVYSESGDSAMDQGSAFRPLDSSAIQQALQSSKLYMPVLDFSQLAPLPHNRIENVEVDRMDRASQGSQEKTASLWEPSPSIQPPNLPGAAERMASSVEGKDRRQSATPSVASSRPASPRQVDVSTQTRAPPLKPSAAETAAATSRIIDWIPDTRLSSIGYILGSLKDEVKTQPIASSMVSELERLWFPAPPPEPIQPPPDEIPPQVSRAPSVVVEKRDSNPPSVVSQQERSPASKSPPPPDRTIANSRRDHDTSIDDEIGPRPVEPRVTHEGPPSAIGDGPVKDTEKRWFDSAEWDAIVTQLTSKMIKSTFEALQPTVRKYVQQYLNDHQPAKADPPLVEYLDEAAIRSLQRDTIDETYRQSKARSSPRGSTVDNAYYEPKGLHHQDSRYEYTEYERGPSPTASSRPSRPAPNTDRPLRPDPSYQRRNIEEEYDTDRSQYTSWPKEEVHWDSTVPDRERTFPRDQRDYGGWKPRSSVPGSWNGMRIDLLKTVQGRETPSGTPSLVITTGLHRRRKCRSHAGSDLADSQAASTEADDGRARLVMDLPLPTSTDTLDSFDPCNR